MEIWAYDLFISSNPDQTSTNLDGKPKDFKKWIQKRF